MEHLKPNWTNTISVYALIHTDTNDANVLSTNAKIPVGNSSVCVYVVAYDDPIAEYDESVLIIIRPDNPLDVVNQNTTLLINDNDGLYSIKLKL